MKKILLTAVALLTLSATCFAESGTTGTLTWTLSDDGTLTISGDGAIPNYVSLAPWYSYINDIKTVDIYQGVTGIGSNAFKDCKFLMSVTISKSVAIIGSNAFAGCENLTSITVPGGVRSIGKNAFGNLRHLVLEDGTDTLSVVGYSSTTFPPPQPITVSSSGSFSDIDTLYCGRIINASFVYAPRYVFSPSIKEVTFGDYVTSIANYTFAGCVNLTAIYVTAINPPELYNNTFLDVPTDIPVYVRGKVEDYTTAEGWKEFINILPYVNNGIELPEAAGSIRIYPNPVDESFYINGITVPTIVTVTDFSGRTVLTQKVNCNEPVSVGRLPKGVYIVGVNGYTVKIAKL
jgi:hypothetical protein